MEDDDDDGGDGEDVEKDPIDGDAQVEATKPDVS